MARTITTVHAESVSYLPPVTFNGEVYSVNFAGDSVLTMDRTYAVRLAGADFPVQEAEVSFASDSFNRFA